MPMRWWRTCAPRADGPPGGRARPAPADRERGRLGAAAVRGGGGWCRLRHRLDRRRRARRAARRGAHRAARTRTLRRVGRVTAPPTHSRHARGDGACQRTRSRPGRGLTEAGARGHRDPATLLSTAGTAGAAPSPLWCMLDSRASRTVSDTPICAPVAPTLFISDADVATLADWRSAVAGLAAAYAADVKPAMVPPRSMAR